MVSRTVNSTTKLFKLLAACWLGVLLWTACKEDDAKPANLEGVWLQEESSTDTLSFWQDDAFFELSRENELRNGQYLPATGSGIYEYQLHPDSIAIRSMLSSFSGYQKFYYSLRGNELTIENFYDKNNSQEHILTFIRLE
ncbi:hypothetical protein PZB74_15350 [Porifericola rhodea]|uniref:hypothetical protein n=1 Tax=Porifericola rhodea TaxID=930972 RepID=UPI002666F126|nr:hypothetical protein [Porifericola rhodea]WKN30340.1 hypothetical protein PZB74_15350 [Porifericola rhodea]